MTTISVPLTNEYTTMLDSLVSSGFADNRASAMRKALHEAAREHALQNLLNAQREIHEGKGLQGDLRSLVAAID